MTTLPLSTMHRFYIYAIHGYVTEVMFTAAWEFVVNFNFKFPGNTSVWSLFIYGMCTLFIERLYFLLKDRVNILVRAAIYTCITYSWEFSTGYLLRHLGACPWDYTPFENDFMGLITLEYLPFWFFGNIAVEQILIRYTQQLHWGPNHVEVMPVDGATSQVPGFVEKNGYVRQKNHAGPTGDGLVGTGEVRCKDD